MIYPELIAAREIAMSLKKPGHVSGGSFATVP